MSASASNTADVATAMTRYAELRYATRQWSCWHVNGFRPTRCSRASARPHVRPWKIVRVSAPPHA